MKKVYCFCPKGPLNSYDHSFLLESCKDQLESYYDIHFYVPFEKRPEQAQNVTDFLKSQGVGVNSIHYFQVHSKFLKSYMNVKGLLNTLKSLGAFNLESPYEWRIHRDEYVLVSLILKLVFSLSGNISFSFFSEPGARSKLYFLNRFKIINFKRYAVGASEENKYFLLSSDYRAQNLVDSQTDRSLGAYVSTDSIVAIERFIKLICLLRTPNHEQLGFDKIILFYNQKSFAHIKKHMTKVRMLLKKFSLDDVITVEVESFQDVCNNCDSVVFLGDAINESFLLRLYCHYRGVLYMSFGDSHICHGDFYKLLQLFYSKLSVSSLAQLQHYREESLNEAHLACVKK